jgi:hypothetical protein
MAASPCVAAILRDASLRDAPQDEDKPLVASWFETALKKRLLTMRIPI